MYITLSLFVISFIFYVGVGYIYRRNLFSLWSKAGKKFIDLDTYSDLICYIFLHALNGGESVRKSVDLFHLTEIHSRYGGDSNQGTEQEGELILKEGLQNNY